MLYFILISNVLSVKNTLSNTSTVTLQSQASTFLSFFHHSLSKFFCLITFSIFSLYLYNNCFISFIFIYFILNHLLYFIFISNLLFVKNTLYFPIPLSITLQSQASTFFHHSLSKFSSLITFLIFSLSKILNTFTIIASFHLFSFILF